MSALAAALSLPVLLAAAAAIAAALERAGIDLLGDR